jgi:CubicO group peptidase (beta-lactamase class C family)
MAEFFHPYLGERIMVRRFAVALIWVTSYLVWVTSCLAQNKNAVDVVRMEQIIDSYVPKQFMGTVLVAEDGKILLDKGYGFANLEWQVPNTPATKFRLASITKQFTAASILVLEERGKLKVEDPVKKYMPDPPTAWDKITIFNLLTHTSGIPNFTDFPDYRDTEATTTTPEKLVARFRDKPLDFEPGTKWNYSNSGYVLLGYLIEKINGQTYSDFVQQNIFMPLGMKDSGYDFNSAVIDHRAAGYSPSKDGPINAGFINMTIPYSAGALYSTTEDLLRWEQGLFGGKLLKQESLAKMTTPFKEDYAFGLGVTTVDGHKRIAHGGGIEGFNTSMSYFPDDKLVVVVLANLNGPFASTIDNQLAQVAHGQKVVLISERKEITISPDILKQYLGTYELSPSFSLVMTLENGQLMSQATNQGKLPLFAESETKFFLKVLDSQVEFFKNDKGEVTHLVVYQNGRERKLVKK